MEKILIYTDREKQARIDADIDAIATRANDEIIPRLRSLNVEPTAALIGWVLKRNAPAVRDWLEMVKRSRIKDKVSRHLYRMTEAGDRAELFAYMENLPEWSEQQKRYIGGLVYDDAAGRATVPNHERASFHESCRHYLTSRAQADKYELQGRICDLLRDFFGTERGGRIPSNWDKCFLDETGEGFAPRLLKDYGTLK